MALRGYGRKNESRIVEYIKDELKQNEMGEQLTMNEAGSFTGRKQQSPHPTYCIMRSTRGEEQMALPACETLPAFQELFKMKANNYYLFNSEFLRMSSFTSMSGKSKIRASSSSKD